MKVCELCNENPASVYITQAIDGESVSMYICEQCAEQNGISVSEEEGEVTFDEELLEKLYNQAQHEITDKNQDKKRCKCGTTWSEFREFGFLGCASCYETFRDEINDIFLEIHSSVVHKGKKLEKEEKVDVDIGRLKRKLSEAINNEMFEEAAMLRDNIKRLKSNGEIYQ